jgi:hypothetical protein
MPTLPSRQIVTPAALALLTSIALPSGARAQTPPATPPTPAAPAAPAPDPHATYAGTFSYVGGQRETTELDHAIDRAVDGMFFVAAAVARGRLHGKNPVYNHVALQFPSGQIAIAFDGRAPYTSPENGGRVQARDLAGDPVRVSQHWENGHVVQVIATDAGYRRNDFILSADGHTLTMRVEMVSPSLPHHLNYSLTFHR